MKNVSEVLLEAALLEPDVQTRIVCPFCQGGSTSERCMSIVRTAEGVVKYICHRANCGIAGRNNTPSTDVEVKVRPPRQIREVKLRPLAQDELDTLWKEWGLSATSIAYARWKWDELLDRIAFPVLSMDGRMRGLVLRATKLPQKPKVLNVQWEPNEPFLAWYQGLPYTDIQRLLIVEDIPSALKAANTNLFHYVVALNGTHISQEALADLAASRCTDNVVLALDEDASEKALAYSRDLAIYLGRIRVLLLTKDLKNMPTEEVTSCLLNVLS